MNFNGDDDAIWGNQAHYHLSNGGSRYPVHDCCEMRSADELKVMKSCTDAQAVLADD